MATKKRSASVSLISPDNATSFAFLIGFIVLATSRREILHVSFVPACLLLVLLDIFQWTSVIGRD